MSFIKDKILGKKSEDEEDGHQLSLVNVSPVYNQFIEYPVVLKH